MTNRQKILENLSSAKALMVETLELLRTENSDGKQFDYVNAPRLSDNFDGLNRCVNKVGKIVYQEATI